MKIVIFLLGLLLIFGMPVTALAIEVGLGASFSNKFLNVFNADGKEIAALEGDSGLWPHISIKSHDRYFGDSSFGYSFYGWYTQGGVDKVKNRSERVLPSRINLSFLYAGATAFYVLGNKLVTKDNGHTQHAIGIGAGWGASKINGTIPAAYTSTGVDERIDSNLTGSSANIFYRYLWEGMYFLFDASTVQVNNGGRRYDSTESSLTIGHYFDF